MKADPSLTLLNLRDQLQGRVGPLQEWKLKLAEREEATEKKNIRKGEFEKAFVLLKVL